MAHNWATTPPFRDYLKMEKEDRHLWYSIATGHHRNLFDEAVAEVERLKEMARQCDLRACQEKGCRQKLEAEVDRLKAEVRDLSGYGGH